MRKFKCNENSQENEKDGHVERKNNDDIIKKISKNGIVRNQAGGRPRTKWMKVITKDMRASQNG